MTRIQLTPPFQASQPLFVEEDQVERFLARGYVKTAPRRRTPKKESSEE